MRIVALLATRNERRFIAGVLDHLIANGVDVYLIDNESADATVEIAREYLGKGLIGIETLPYSGVYDWRAILRRKEELANSLDADWIMHADADEIHLAPRGAESLHDAIARVDRAGFTAINFMEFTFVPTVEAPEHDHPDFEKTMRSYYPFAPQSPWLVRAWKQSKSPAEIAWSGGHLVRFDGLRLAPETFAMRHYLFLGIAHAIEKYVSRPYDPEEVAQGWHGWRARLRKGQITLPHQKDLRRYTGDNALDASNPRTRHILDDVVIKAE